MIIAVNVASSLHAEKCTEKRAVKLKSKLVSFDSKI